MTTDNRKTICMIGAFPPPINGQAVAFEMLSNSSDLLDKYNVIKIDYASKWNTYKFLMTPYKIIRNYLMIRKLKRVIRENQVDIFYLGISSSNQGTTRDWHITKTIEKELQHAKFVIHHHGGNFRTFYESTDDKHREMLNSYLRKVDRAIVLTPKLKGLFKGLLPDEKIRVVSNGISLSDQLPDGVVDNKIERLKHQKTINILFLSNLIRTKGFFELLQAAPVLLENGVDFQITYAGVFTVASEKLPFNEYILKNGLEKYITYKGLVVGDQKRTLLSESDIFVLPTSFRNEGQPISILESMSAGMAIVTTDHGGITDVVKDGINGIILPEVSPNAISNAIIQLNNNRVSLIKICEENRRTAKEKYMEDHFVHDMIEVFDEVVI